MKRKATFSITVCIEGSKGREVSAYFKRHRGELSRPIAQVILARTNQLTRLQEAVRFMQEHCCRDDLREEEVASHVGWDAVTFSTLFRRLMGKTYISRLTQMRVSAAKELLRQSGLVQDVALRVGFRSSTAFFGAFKRTTGLNPCAFRIHADARHNGSH
jgi:two-component system, response regulator YesN